MKPRRKKVINSNAGLLPRDRGDACWDRIRLNIRAASAGSRKKRRSAKN